MASGRAKYAIYVEAQPTAAGTRQGGVLYILEPQATAAQYAGQRVRITGTVSETPIARAGQTYAPDAVATYKSAAGDQKPVNAVSGEATPATGTGSPDVQSQERALDKTTRVAGLLTISSVEVNPR